MHYSTIGVALTQKCTANCSVCCFECNPNRTEAIDLEQLTAYIQSSKTVGSIDTISFTGGEAFLLYDKLIELSKLCVQAGKNTTVITNGFWANSQESAETKMLVLKQAGVGEIAVSYDEFHGEYIPVQNIVNYIKAAKKCNLPPVIQSIVQKKPNLNWLSDIGSDLSDAIVHFIPFYSVGAAKKTCSEMIAKPNSVQNCLCRKTGAYSVLYDGTIWPCCSPYVQETALSVGNIKSETVQSTLDKFENHIILRNLRRYGFDFYLNSIKRYNIDIAIPDSIVSSCELCALLFSHENIEKFFPAILNYR